MSEISAGFKLFRLMLGTQQASGLLHCELNHFKNNLTCVNLPSSPEKANFYRLNANL